MAARKLLYPEQCEVPCNPITNKDGVCPGDCSNICPIVCNQTVSSYTYPSAPPLSSDLDSVGHDLPSGKKHHHGIAHFLTISLVVVSVIVFLLACYSVYKFCNDRYNLRRRRRRNLDLLVEEEQPGRDEFLDEVQGPNQAVEHHIWYIRTIGLDPAVISKITVVEYKKGEGLVEGTDCSVCLSEFEEGESLRLLPKCNHAFHLPCVDTWLTAHTNCPLCRAPVVSNSAGLGSDEQQHDSGLVEEEIRAEISVGMDEVVEADEVVVGVGVEDGEVDENAQVAVRRSVSMDAISASRLALAVNNASAGAGQSDDDVDEVKELDDGAIVPKGNGINQRLLKLVGSFSIDRPACIKRSVSCNANV